MLGSGSEGETRYSGEGWLSRLAINLLCMCTDSLSKMSSKNTRRFRLSLLTTKHVKGSANERPHLCLLYYEMVMTLNHGHSNTREGRNNLLSHLPNQELPEILYRRKILVNMYETVHFDIHLIYTNRKLHGIFCI